MDKENYYPSPALFVYTLPNIVTGELAIRHQIYGETACYVLPSLPVWEIYKDMVLTKCSATQVIIGWIECKDDTEYEAHVELLNKC